jgi:CRP-like cAMP-binding protein
MATATAMTHCTLVGIEKLAVGRLLHEQHDVSELFVTHLLSRNIRFEEDLVDQLFNLEFGPEGRGRSQETLRR